VAVFFYIFYIFYIGMRGLKDGGWRWGLMVRIVGFDVE
jgi:hypothetical protein